MGVMGMAQNRRSSLTGQSTLEYAVLISVIAAAVLGMQIYLKRGIAGRVKASTDQIGDQFSPQNTNYSTRTTFQSTRLEETNTGQAGGGIGQAWSRSEIQGGQEVTTRTADQAETTGVGLGAETLYDPSAGIGTP